MLTQTDITTIFTYKDGFLYWNISPSKNVKINSKAGTEMLDGYICIRYKGKGYKAHRLIWIYHFGELKYPTIDHLNGNRSDNRIENLRNVSQKVNQQNRQFAKGYCWNKRVGKYQAQVERNGKKIWLGYYPSAILARDSYLQEKGLC